MNEFEQKMNKVYGKATGGNVPSETDEIKSTSWIPKRMNNHDTTTREKLGDRLIENKA